MEYVEGGHRPVSETAAAARRGARSMTGRTITGGRAGRATPARLPDTHRRGRDATGLGYLSGHAGVAVALGAAALPHLGPAGRALTLGAIPAVSLTRIYVGAHLPLDTAGGAALGLAIDAALA